MRHSVDVPEADRQICVSCSSGRDYARNIGSLQRFLWQLAHGLAWAWRCVGQALQAQGYHQDAINAFRKAKQYDPNDRTLDAAIDRSQKGIVADFISRNRR